MTAPTLADLDRAKLNLTAWDSITNGALSTTIVTPGGRSVKTIATAIQSLLAFNPRGNWATLSVYALKDVVNQGGVIYACLVPHTAGTFATDLAAGKWVVFQGLVNPEPALESIADLRALHTATYPSGYAFVMSWIVGKSRGGGAFAFDAADTTTADNGVTVIVDADGGRWKRLLDGDITTDMAGAQYGGADDTAKVNAALAAAGTRGGGAVRVPDDVRCLIDSADLIVPAGVTLQGPWVSPGLTPDAMANYSAVRGALIINPTYGIKLRGRGAAVRGLFIMRKGLTTPTNATTAQTLIDSFAGTAITIGDGTNDKATDCYVGHNCILGFAQAIYDDYSCRYTIEFNRGDCHNGIYTTNIFDIGRVRHNHFWPFLTYGFSWSADPDHLVWYRPGTAFDVDVGNDDSEFIGNFAYGYKVGFHIGAANGTDYIGNSVDAQALSFASSDSTVKNTALAIIGVLLDGAAQDVRWSGGNISAQGKGVVVDTANSGTAACLHTFENVTFAGNAINHVYQKSDRVDLLGCNLQDFYALAENRYAVEATSAAKETMISQSTFFNVAPWLISHRSFQQNNNRFLGASVGPSAETDVYTGSVSSNMPRDRFLYTTQPEGVINAFHKARGTPASPAAAIANDVAGSFVGRLTHNGTTFHDIAGLRFQGRTTPSGSNSSGCVMFSTTAVGDVATTDRMVVDANGNLVPLANNAYSIGGPNFAGTSVYWSAIYAINGTIQTSDERTKTAIADSVLGLDFINGLRPVSYKFKVGSNVVKRQVYLDKDGQEIPEGEPVPPNSTPGRMVTQELPGVRTHWGLIAQEVKAVCDAAGVDFGGWILENKDDPNSPQGLRYDQFVAPLIRAVQQLTARVAQLEQQLAP